MPSPQAPEMLLTQEDTSDSPSATPTAGQLLKAARQAKGVHLAVLAVTLKVPVRQLEALEADHYDAFKGGPTFLRAITSSMCRHLGIDASPVLALLPSAVSSMGAARPALEPVSGLQRVSLRPRGVRSARPVLILALLMLLGTAAFLWLPSPEAWWPAWSSSASSVTQVEEAAVPLGQASNPESSEEAASAASPASAALPVSSPAASAPALSASNALSSIAPAPSASALAAVSAKTPAAPAVVNASPAVLRLEASADTWVEVRDAKGQTMGQLLKASESMNIQQSVPYSVVIGRAAAVKATLRGQPFDLKPHAPQSVARFEVKE